MAACGTSGAPASVDRAGPALQRVDLGTGHRGLSGLTRGERGRLWAVSERGGWLLGFAPDGHDQVSFHIRGVTGDFDLESLAWLGGDRFAVGTEGHADGRASDAILVVEIAGAAAYITDRIALDYGRLAIAAKGNQGIEGLCAVEGVLLGAFETPVIEGGHRAARIARIVAADESWIALSVSLTSETGKISALDCRRRGAGLEVLAVERHFEVARILHFVVPDDLAEGAVLRPRIAADLNGVRRASDNPEGIVWIDDRTAYLILDNNFGSDVGPTELLRVSIAVDR